MRRMYVIIKEDVRDYGVPNRKLYDVVFSMLRAEEICDEKNEADIDHCYYWREVISSEE